MAVNPFVSSIDNNRTPAMAQPQIQSLQTPMSVGAQAIRDRFVNGTGGNPNGITYDGGGFGTTPAPSFTASNGSPDWSNYFSRLSQQVDGIDSLTDNGKAYTPIDPVGGPVTQTAAGGVMAPESTPNWQDLMSRRFSAGTGARAAAPPRVMMPSRLPNAGG